MDKVNKPSEALLKLVAVGSFFLLLIGFIQINFKFLLYHIDITNFMNSSEIVMLTIKNTLTVFWTIFMVVYITGIMSLFYGYDFLKIKAPIRLIRLVMFLFLVIISILIIYYSQTKSKNLIYCLTVLFSVGILQALITFLYSPTLKEKIERNKKAGAMETIIKVLVCMMLYAFSISISSYVINKKGLNTEKIELLLSDSSKILTSDKLIFIGKTEHFYFIWNKDLDKTTVYPESRITSLTYYSSK